MSLLVVPLVRALTREALRKATFSRGPKQGHKYLKRVPYFVNGKRRWRYYYADEAARTAGITAHDPEERHEHYLKAELKKHHRNLASKLMATADITLQFLKKTLGVAGTKVTQGAEFTNSYVRPEVERELAGEETRRRASQQVLRAFEMLPEYLKEQVSPESIKGIANPSETELGKYVGLKKVSFNTSSEDPYIMAGGCYGYAAPGKGTLHVLDSAFDAISHGGEYKYKSGVTQAETTIWHEFGHHVHFSMESSPKDSPDKKAIEQWKAGLPGAKISNYAETAWYEDFAESFSCAIAYPKQLAETCPERYEWLRKHVITSLPPIADMLDTPKEDLAWWESKPDTPASKLLRHLQFREPAPRFHTYQSEKDQFYSVQKDGRSIFLRVGPASKDEEDGWARMPETTYTETITGADGQPIEVTLPKHERLVGPRFKKTGSIKEIYDENGRPLTDSQAYFYLGQDDEKTIKAAGETGTREDLDAYITKRDSKETQKKGDTRLLSYKMYTTLGFQLEHAKEKQRLEKVVVKQKAYDIAFAKQQAGKKLTAKDKTLLYDKKTGNPKERPDFGLERHEWAPIEMPKTAFMQSTSTFQFGDVRPSGEQKWIARDPKTGKPITRYDSAADRQVPVLTAREYSQENPDGTFTRILVNESSAFNVGSKIWVPILGGGKKRITLEEGMPLDPFQLAREHNTSATELLAMNNRFGRGQITDPVLAALINPSAKPITDSTMLQQLMQDAALDTHMDPVTKRVVGRRAWVSLRGSSRQDSGVAHIQVEFDGAGPPKVVGSYWAQKIGKSSVRIDELLSKRDEIEAPRIAERRAKKRGTNPGATVWFYDPKSERRILGTVLPKAKGSSSKLIRVQPLPGQGIGISKLPVAVKTVEATKEDLLPSKPLLRKRIVEPLADDVLLYMDEVPKNSRDDDPRGVIKILLPKSEKWTFQGMLGHWGVRALSKGENAELTISAEDLPRFRESLGGFIMDSRVKARLAELDARARKTADQANKKQLVETTDLEDEHGNINPNGPLRGLVLGDDGIQPGAHRMKALQKLAKNGGRLYAAHFMGTGKTALAIMGAEMMRNLENPDTKRPHASRLKGRAAFLVPLNTAENWYQEFVKFASPPTLVGASTLSGAQQIPKLIPRKPKEGDDAYRARFLEHWKTGLAKNPNWWDPWSDNRDNVVVPFEYWRDNEAAMSMLDQFDGMVIDEAHKVARENEISRGVERWAPKMKMMLMLSGTPITNTIDTLPRIVELVTAGEVQLGSKESFRETYMAPSAVMRAAGKKNPPITDLNPQKVGELASILQPLIDVATTADVKGKSMPAVLLDENEPAHMQGQQARLYRAAMAILTDDEREALGASASLGVDEQAMLSESARRKVSAARSLANCPAYKSPDQTENLTYKTTEYTQGKGSKAGQVIATESTRLFELPSLRMMTAKRPKGWGGRWPSSEDVVAGRVDQGYLNALHRVMDRVLGVAYESIEGKAIDKNLLAQIKKGTFETVMGEPWGPQGGRLKNPDYGPEGMVCRGRLDEVTGEVVPLKTRYYDPDTGTFEELSIPVGTRFVRDPRSKASGLFWHEKDWDYTGRFATAGEGEEKGGAEGDEEEDEEGKKKVDKSLQGPKEGHETHSIQRSPARRRERAMFDAVVTQGNAKCDKLEQQMRTLFKEHTGDGAGKQTIIFGNRIGSSVRTVEAKMRSLGYMDVNEALGNPEWSSAADKAAGAQIHKFFVSYMGKSATLGDRDINSEIFRRQQDSFGRDTGVSMMVWRTLYGTTKQKFLAPGQMREPWGRSHRKKILGNFMDGRGKLLKNGSPAGLEIPMRVVGATLEDGSVGQQYIYESEVPLKVRREVQALEIQARSQRGAVEAATMARISELLMPFAVDRKPLTPAQIDIFNNTQVMVASDAANVGLNWPDDSLFMYDSLFSPMEEWQRITRAARMMPPAVRGPAKELILKIGEYINAAEAKSGFKEYEGIDSAMLIVNEAIENHLTEAERLKLNDLPGGAPDQIVEAWFAQRAFNKIASLRDTVGNRLRTQGAKPDPTKPAGKDNFIHPSAIQESDVMNEIIRTHLTPFDREIMKSRRYLVDVKRLLTSVDVPEFEIIKVTDPDTGKPKKIQVPTGKWTTESPSSVERAQLAQGRAKMVPYEYLLQVIQSAQPQHTEYGYIDAYSGSLGSFSRMPDEDEGTPPEGAKKALRFYVLGGGQ